MSVLESMIKEAFKKFIKATMNRFDVTESMAYTHAEEAFNDELSLVAISMFIYGYIKADEQYRIKDKDIKFELIHSVIKQEIEIYERYEIQNSK